MMGKWASGGGGEDWKGGNSHEWPGNKGVWELFPAIPTLLAAASVPGGGVHFCVLVQMQSQSDTNSRPAV